MIKSPDYTGTSFFLAESGPRKLIWRKLCQRLLPFLGQKWFRGMTSRIVSLLAASGLWNLIWTNLKLSRKNVVPDSLLSDCKTNSQRQINKILQMEYYQQQLQFDLKSIHFSSFTKRKTACQILRQELFVAMSPWNKIVQRNDKFILELYFDSHGTF